LGSGLRRRDETVSRPIQARVSLSAIRHNYWVAKRAAARSKVFAVVKANAYGHGIERIARALPQADGFATLELEGAIALRERNVVAPILLLEGFFEPAELRLIASASLATVIHNEEQLRILETQKPDRLLDVWLKVNTGMNRLGIRLEHVRPALERLKLSGTTRSITLMTHFATADGAEGVGEAMKRFDEATRGIALPRSLANTAAIYAHPESQADIVRLGIGLYGATPFADRSAQMLGLKPAMTLSSKLIAIQEMKPGDSVGYGGEFKVDRPTRIGVVACGYADGYPRHAPSGTPMLVAGARVKTAGRVSMDMLCVDLTGVPAATVGYELLCAVAPRVPMMETDAA